MSLKYPFREVFRRKILRPKRLWAVLEDLDERITGATGSDTSLSESISALAETVGDSTSGLVKAVADLSTSKANANHSHTTNNIINVGTVDVVVTYTDNSTETITLLKEVPSNHP